MSVIINTNLYAYSAQNNLTRANNLLGSNIERLSSGLRINHASDDASGLAIAEKLRAQIQGLKRASMNSQDGISFLQTAEGGLNSIADMLQRMRELAVQAGNGTYTANDRAELQKEVDQLKDEINRVSRTTEFNTKKLLNGNATAIWSANKNHINALVRGEVNEGNYRMEFTTVPGKNEVYKTDIMTLKGVMAGQITSTNTTNVRDITAINNIKHSGKNGVGNYDIVISGNVTADASAVILTSINTGDWAIQVTSMTTIGFDGYIEIEYLTANATLGDFKDVKARFRTIDAKTGKISDWTHMSADATTGIFTLNNGTTIDMTTSFLANPTGKVNKNDRVILHVSRAITNATDVDTTDGRGIIRISGGPENMQEIRLNYDTTHALTKPDNNNTVEDVNKVEVFIPRYVGNNLTVGSMTFNFTENIQTDTGTFTLHVQNKNEVATEDTKLKDINLFTNADGRMILDNTPELTIYGNGKQISIYIEANDTIKVLEEKLTEAIISLGMGATKDTAETADINDVNENLVNYVIPNDSTELSNEAVEGTFVIQTALLGDNSRLYFRGDEALLNALSLATIQPAVNSETTIDVTDAHTGDNIGKYTTTENTLLGVIKGVDVEFASNMGVRGRWDDVHKRIEYTSNTKPEIAFLHLCDNRTDIQSGANKGQHLNVSIDQVDTDALGISDLYVLSMEMSQKAITKIDIALARVNNTRSGIGAQVNRLEHTLNNLAIARQNMIMSESRIRDLDVAEESSNFSRNQVLVNSATALLAQANQFPQTALQLIGR